MLLARMDSGFRYAEAQLDTFLRAVYEKSPVRLIVDHANTLKQCRNIVAIAQFAISREMGK